MKFTLQKCGFGRSYYHKIVSVSDKEGSRLKKEGIKVFDTRSEAQEYIKEKK